VFLLLITLPVVANNDNKAELDTVNFIISVTLSYYYYFVFLFSYVFRTPSLVKAQPFWGLLGADVPPLLGALTPFAL